MDFNELLKIVGNDPFFETGLLLAGQVDPADVQRQLSRWTKAGRIYQLRRGLYTLAPPYQKIKPHPFLLANQMVSGSYVSLQSVLSYHGVIPDVVAITTSVTTGRPGRRQTLLGAFDFRHVKHELFWGYRVLKLGGDQQAFVASVEKALLDLLYLQPNSDDPGYLQGLRLQNLERLDNALLTQMAQRTGSAKLQKAVRVVTKLAQNEAEEYELL